MQNLKIITPMLLADHVFLQVGNSTHNTDKLPVTVTWKYKI